MKLLVLGGTIFLGRHVVEAARARGHEVTLFHRGQHNPGLFPDLPVVLGDRKTDLEKLAGGSWDAVLDTSGYVPRVVTESARFFADRAQHYTFISSISVFSDLTKPWIDESAPVGRLETETEEVTGETYGPLKALCEEAAEAAMPGRVWNVRPGLIVGPDDPTHRFTYWPARFAQGDEILVPDIPNEPIQVIDVRDLAEWLVRGMEEKLTGVYNATGPAEPFTWRELVDTCTDVVASGPDAPAVHPHVTWVSEAFLQEKKVGAWMELPLWVPVEPESVAFSRISIEKAKQAGLTFRPLEATVRDTLAWFRTQPDRDWPAGLAERKESALLTDWHRTVAENA
ncbi:MAG: epimerase [Candidatus Eisenbacteria bacterium]|uniref:Epimerase n=1 Tax=Eiseniibacteriota bacterium TaxID=2212470 RepID=A0A956SD83_UNCEI|nr:epimerase [Candidatus Eisenbacteria bacterium]